jgi:hypothetical protein
MNQSRRKYLVACSAGLSFGLGGCFMFNSSSRSNPIKIVDLYINNLDKEPHEMGILIQNKGKITYWKTVSVDARNGRKAGGAVLHDYPKKPGYYTIIAKRDGQSYVKLNIAKFESSCCKVIPQINKQGDLNILHSVDCQPTSQNS